MAKPMVVSAPDSCPGQNYLEQDVITTVENFPTTSEQSAFMQANARRLLESQVDGVFGAT